MAQPDKIIQSHTICCSRIICRDTGTKLVELFTYKFTYEWSLRLRTLKG